MSSPGKDNTHEPETGTVYEDCRNGELMEILYLDEQVVLLRMAELLRDGTHGHRMESRPMFERNAEAGRYKQRPDTDRDLLTSTAADWTEVPCIGEKTAANLHDAGYTTLADVAAADLGELHAVDGVGQKAARNLFDHA